MSSDFHEAQKLHLQNERLTPLWDGPQVNFSITVERTIKWYLGFHNGVSPLICACLISLSMNQL